MKEDKFQIIIIAKKILFNLDDILCRFPNKEKVLKDRFKTTMYDLIEYIYLANYLPLNEYREKRKEYQVIILSKISIIDLLLEESYKKRYLPEELFKTKVKELTDLYIKVKGWISGGKSNNKTGNGVL